GRDAGHAEPLAEPGEPAVARAVAPPERPLQLDPEALRAEGGEQAARQRLGARRIATLPEAGRGAVAGTARKANETLGMPAEGTKRQKRGEGVAPRLRASPGMSFGYEAAEVAPAGRALDQ